MSCIIDFKAVVIIFSLFSIVKYQILKVFRRFSFMFCSKCGKDIPDGMVNCSSCNANRGVVFKEKNAKSTIIKIIALVLAILFFFPMFTVSCSGGFGMGDYKIPFSGLDFAIEKDIDTGFGSYERTEANLYAWLLLLLPIVIFMILLSKSKSAYLTGFILSVVGVILFYIFSLEVTKKIVEQNYGTLSVNFTVSFYASIILYVVAGILCLVGFLEKKQL